MARRESSAERVVLRPLTVLTAVVSIAACSAVKDERSESVGRQQQAVFSAEQVPDVTFGAVGLVLTQNQFQHQACDVNLGIAKCTATLVGPQVALSAAHCFTSTVRHCGGPIETTTAQALRAGVWVQFSQNGDLSD